jgi:hypothetical protein
VRRSLASDTMACWHCHMSLKQKNKKKPENIPSLTFRLRICAHAKPS